jgi:hypothetical protein
MPPGKAHAVLTTSNCVAIGGHFISGQHFDLTMQARMHGHFYGWFWNNVNNYIAKAFMQRMLIYASTQIMEVWTRDMEASAVCHQTEDPKMHQELTSSPYPHISLACLVYMCANPNLFVIQFDDEPLQEDFPSAEQYEAAVARWNKTSCKAAEEKRGLTSEYRKQREAAQDMARELSQFVGERVHHLDGPHWVCLKERLEDAGLLNVIRRDMEAGYIQRDPELLRQMQLAVSEENMDCNGQGSCRSQAIIWLRDHQDQYYLSQLQTDLLTG